MIERKKKLAVWKVATSNGLAFILFLSFHASAEESPPAPPVKTVTEDTEDTDEVAVGDPNEADDAAKSADLIARYKQLLVKKPTQEYAFAKLLRIHLETGKVNELLKGNSRPGRNWPSNRSRVSGVFL